MKTKMRNYKQISIVWIMSFLLICFHIATAEAGILDGHLKDLVSRFTAEEHLDGTVIKQGNIRESDEGQDFVHWARGEVSIVEKNNKYYVQLESTFVSSLGPDYHVYVSPSAHIADEDDFNTSTQYELGRLKKGSGASFYELGDILPSSVYSVTIWCKQFGEFIGSATVR